MAEAKEILDKLKSLKSTSTSMEMKRRKGFRKKIGHRKLYTKIRIESIA